MAALRVSQWRGITAAQSRILPRVRSDLRLSSFRLRTRMDAGSAKSSTVSAYGFVRANWPISRVRRLYNSVRSPVRGRHTAYGSTKLKAGSPPGPVYDAAFRLKPRDSLAYRFRGDAHIAQGNYDQAISACSRALNLSPDYPIAYFTCGNAHLFSGKLELALADFNAAVEADPVSGRSTYGRRLVRELMGDAEGAAKDYRRAREMGYDDQNIECEA